MTKTKRIIGMVLGILFIELNEKLSLTGAEISLNELPAGANVPFVHSHK